MDNRFNTTEQEKNHIRGLHKNHPIVSEQRSDWTGHKEDTKWWEGKDESQMLDDLDIGAQMLKDYVSQIRDGVSTEKELGEIQEFIEYHIIQLQGSGPNAKG